MSLVIAIKDKNRIVLGADKQASTGASKDHTCTKIWEVQELPGALMGGVGSARASQVIQYSKIIDKNFIVTEPDTEFIVNILTTTISATLQNAGIQVETENGDIMLPNAFIFAYKDKAWMIWNDLSVTEIEDYFAIGSGSDVANGALFATKTKNPFERIVTSIDAAAETTLFVDDGVDVLLTEERPGDQKALLKAFGLTVISSADTKTKKNSETPVDNTVQEAS